MTTDEKLVSDIRFSQELQTTIDTLKLAKDVILPSQMEIKQKKNLDFYLCNVLEFITTVHKKANDEIMKSYIEGVTND